MNDIRIRDYGDGWEVKNTLSDVTYNDVEKEFVC